MFKGPKPPLKWPRGFTSSLDLWSSSSDRVLHALLHRDGPSRRFNVRERVEFEGKLGGRPSSIDDQMAGVVLALLGTSGVVTGWALFVS
jgi:hypothetical protein